MNVKQGMRTGGDSTPQGSGEEGRDKWMSLELGRDIGDKARHIEVEGR